MINNYLKYLEFVNKKLSTFFQQQKPFIFCKKGCGKCCKNAEFPYSQIEADYLISGGQKLDDEKLNQVIENIENIIQLKKNFKGEKFLYDCPFLLNNECCVYEYRGLICRSFGLISIGEDNRNKAPFCCFQGYNYSNVLGEDGKISAQMLEKLNIKEIPLSYNVSYKFLTDPRFETTFDFKFGEKRPLIDWFIKDDDESIKSPH